MQLTLSNGQQVDPATLTGGEQPDSSVVGLQRVIKKLEGGDYQNRSGDAGSSAGAYQWNNQPHGKSIPLKPGELPSNWKNAAAQYLKDPNAPMTQDNQDFVAYQQIHDYKKAGRSPEEIDALWNGSHKEGESYVHNSKTRQEKFRELALGNQGGQNQTPDVSQGTRKTFADSISDIPSTNADSTNLKASTGNGITDALTDIMPGGKLAEGVGYGLNNAMGGQKGLIDANNRSIDIEGQVLAQIKRDKAKGKDTSKLEKALAELTQNIGQNGNNVSDVGTGGISTGDVLKSSASLAALPATAYASTVLGGGGLMGTARGLESGLLGQAIPKFLANPELETVLNMPIKEFQALSNAGKLDALTSSLADEGQGLGASGKLILQKTIDKLAPSVLQEAGIGSFSELNPKTAKALGLGWKALKYLIGGTLLGTGIKKGEDLIGLIK